MWLRQCDVRDDIHRAQPNQKKKKRETKTKNHLVIMCVRYSSFCRLYPQSSTFHRVQPFQCGRDSRFDSLTMRSRYMIRFLRFDANMTFYRQTTIFRIAKWMMLERESRVEAETIEEELWRVPEEMKTNINNWNKYYNEFPYEVHI